MTVSAQQLGTYPFRNYLPVRISFGDGVSAQLPDLLAEHGASRIFVVVDAGVEGFNPAAGALLATLADRGIAMTRYDKPGGEPTIEMFEEAIALLAASNAQAVVAIGGGSVIDTAKSARLCAQLGLTFRGFLESERPYPTPELPLFALPTTAGTGSEVSGGSVVFDLATDAKFGIANPNMRAQYALVDPLLTHSAPPATTAYAGIDALGQAIAAMVAVCRTPIGDAMALEAVRLISRSIVAAYRDGSNAAARSDMACGAMMAGLAMNISECCAEHSLGQAIGGMFHAAHGLTIGLVLVETLDRERQYVPEQLERVADAMGAPQDGTSDGTRALKAISRLLAELEFPVLSSLGVTDEHLDALSAIAVDDYSISTSPEKWTVDEVRDAFSRALALQTRA